MVHRGHLKNIGLGMQLEALVQSLPPSKQYKNNILYIFKNIRSTLI
jgi:hypothetical protein